MVKIEKATDSEVLRSLFEERVLLFNLLLLLDEGGSGCHSSGLGLLSFWLKEDVSRGNRNINLPF